MADSPPEFPGLGVQDGSEALVRFVEPVVVPPLPEPPPRRLYLVRFFVLVVLTFLSMSLHQGFAYSLSVLAILGAHEFGHYVACRYYGVDASLPYFLPMPLPGFLFGTLGAFIRIRQPILSKPQLFDIGVAGPIAGFLVALPVLFTGVYLSTVVPLGNVPQDAIEMGEPLLFRISAWLTFGRLGDDEILMTHPMAFAGWFGLLMTALNLFPFGQLDGGHLSYAVLGPRSAQVSKATVVVVIALAFYSPSWVLWALLLLVMLWTFGPRHPPVHDEGEPLDPVRLWLAGFAALIFIVSFTPAPIVGIGITGR